MACFTPMYLEQHNVYVPCGKCPGCHSARASAWSFRMQQEAKISTSAYFVTLTYDTKHVPITPNGFMSLSKRDCQLFFKRLRKNWPQTIRYYLAGEYGDSFNRPHYHVILFNSDPQRIVDAWGNGDVHIADVNPKTCAYTLKYITKGRWKPMHKRDDRAPLFSLMSKGLGKNYLTEQMQDWHKANPAQRVYCTTSEGVKITMPRYYKDKIYSEEERALIAEHGLDRQTEEQRKQRAANPNHDRDREQYVLNQFVKAKMTIKK
ncbi:replication initiation protein [Tortoise microvirus 91]|nr:replication initiation protein [Tortoise microvirus 91]